MTRTAWVAVVLLSLLTTSVYASCGSRLLHTLENRPWWVSTKPGLKRDVMGSVAFVKTPMALHGNALNLGAWHGFQEIFWSEPVAPRRARFRFRIPDERAYLSFLFNGSSGPFSEIRFSRNPLFPSQWSRLGAEREREAAVPVEGLVLDASWHDAQVDFLADGVAVSVDGSEVFRSDETLENPQRIGFRGSYSTVYLDDVEVRDQRDVVQAADDFEIRSEVWPIALGTIFLVGLGRFVGWRRSRSRPETQRKRTAFQAALLLYLVLLLVALPFAFAERSFLSGRHGYSALHFRVWKWIARPGRPVSSYRHAVPLLRETWVDSEQGDAERILLVGTSQTWGSGASRWDGDLAHRLASRLTDSLAPRTFEVINGGISGRRSDFIYPYYADEWVDWGAETAVFNLGNNDSDPQIFEEMLEKFVELNRDRNIRTVFVLEANSPEVSSTRLLENHEILKAVAKRHDLEVIDLHGSLLEAAADGHMWWDSVHLTDYGQQRAADVLGGALVPLLSKPPAAP